MDAGQDNLLRRAIDSRITRRVLGLLNAIPLPLVGYAFPLAAVVNVLYIPVRSLSRWPRFVTPLLISAALGALMFQVSAGLQGVERPNLSFLSFIAFGLMVLTIAKITDGVETAIAQIAWASVGALVFYVVIGTANTSDSFNHLWKYGIGTPIAFVSTWFFLHVFDRSIVAVAALFAIAVASIAFGFRSEGLICVTAAMFFFIKTGKRTRVRAVFKVALAGVAIYLLSVVLPALIDAGTFGQAVKARTEEQLSTGASPLLAGRVEPPLSIAAIAARPLLGWGNLDAINGHTFLVARQIAASLGLQDPGDYMLLWVRADGHVSVHSEFFEAWTQGGVLAVVMPSLLLMLFVRGIIAARGKWSLAVLLVCIQGLWDVLFSTWGANRPITLAASALVAIWAISEARDGKRAVELVEPVPILVPKRLPIWSG